MNKICVQPITCFEAKGLFLVTVFPSVTKGITTVLCAEKKGSDRLIVVHDCLLCQAYGHEHCPYVKEGIKTYMLYTKQRFHSYEIKQKKVPFNRNWKQIPVPSISAVEHEKVKKDGISRRELAS